jgi:hypothetical protein
MLRSKHFFIGMDFPSVEAYQAAQPALLAGLVAVFVVTWDINKGKVPYQDNTPRCFDPAVWVAALPRGLASFRVCCREMLIAAPHPPSVCRKD